MSPGATGELARGAEVDPELTEMLARGNQALSQGLEGGADGSAETDRAERWATALCVAPRDPAWTEGLVGVIERSALSPERKDAIVSRLRWDQVVSDDVSRAVTAAYGADSAEIRGEALAAVRHGEAGLRASGLEAHRAAELTRALSLIRPWWDEEEEEESQAPGDPATQA
ncbi:MAG: hypothetical protein ABMA64_11500 [Myxococcota bacterium]